MARRASTKAEHATFTATLWRWPGKGGWVFARVPEERAPPVAGPWGRMPCVARVDGTEWKTSVWRDSRHGWLLPVPARIRGKKDDGDEVLIELGPDASRTV